MRRLSTLVVAGAALCLAAAPFAAQSASADKPPTLPGGYKHLVVIYEENHSFDNLYGGWGDVDGQHVEGLADATAANTVQRDQHGDAYTCLLQDDANLASTQKVAGQITTTGPLPGDCHDDHPVNEYKQGTALVTAADPDGFESHFPNKPFQIDDYIAPTDKTCPDPAASSPPNGVPKQTGLEGGCTRDLVHRFYQEQYQIDGGRQDHYMSGSDAVGLSMGTYDTKNLPIYRYLHSPGAPKYVIADHFFQAAFGGSFLNHQWLVAARTPKDTNPAATYTAGGAPAKNSVIDANGMPTSYPLYAATRPVVDDRLTQKCPAPVVEDYTAACGDYAVNTIQPGSAPHGSGQYLPLIDDTAPDSPNANIGDRLSAAGISWNWYTGKWDAALEDAAHAGQAGYVKKAPLFQFHHQPLNYFANYAPGQPGRSHLQDETEFVEAAKNGTLPTVSFVKPYGEENEHPGYASEPNGSDHLVELLKTITEGPQAGNTLVVVTYDEFGGQWDHVAPPTVDKWGPGTRIPAMVVSRSLTHSGVDHTSYDTTSILAMIERSYGLDPLSTRDATVNSLGHAVEVARR